jgi:hypothetical protein
MRLAGEHSTTEPSLWRRGQYLHRDPASRRRPRKGSLKSETVKYGRESQGTWTLKGLRWRGPAAYTKDRPSSRQGGGHKNKTITVKQ